MVILHMAGYFKVLHSIFVTMHILTIFICLCVFCGTGNRDTLSKHVGRNIYSNTIKYHIGLGGVSYFRLSPDILCFAISWKNPFMKLLCLKSTI